MSVCLASPDRSPAVNAARLAAVLSGGVLAAVAATSMASASTAVSTSVKPDVPLVQFHNIATGHCLDSNTSGSAYTLACNGGNYQNWLEFVNGATGADIFESDQTDLCLAVVSESNSNLWSVGTESCPGNPANTFELWRPVSVGGHSGFVNVATGFYLDSNLNGKGSGVGAVYVDPGNGGSYQQWNVT